MRCLHFTSISLSLVLFLCNHAHARIGMTYEESVEKYEKAGFTKERTTVQIPPDDPICGYFPLKMIFQSGVKEITWTNKKLRSDASIHVVKIRQLFYGKWQPNNFNKPWEKLFHCFDITYEFRDRVEDPEHEMGVWVQNLLLEEFRKDDPDFAQPDSAQRDFEWHWHDGDLKKTPRWPAGFVWLKSNHFEWQGGRRVSGMFHDKGRWLNIGWGTDDWPKQIKPQFFKGEIIKSYLDEEIKKCYEAWQKDQKDKEKKRLAEVEAQRRAAMPPPPQPPALDIKIKKEFEESGL